MAKWHKSKIKSFLAGAFLAAILVGFILEIVYVLAVFAS